MQMNKAITLQAHLSLEAVELSYRKAKDAVAKSQWQIIWLVAIGKTTQQIADVTGYSSGWIRSLVRRYNLQGPEALGDRRHSNPGGRWILSVTQQSQLQE